jgi:hypothetical protein
MSLAVDSAEVAEELNSSEETDFAPSSDELAATEENQEDEKQ